VIISNWRNTSVPYGITWEEYEREYKEDEEANNISRNYDIYDFDVPF
jgi:hypothetical protein